MARQLAGIAGLALALFFAGGEANAQLQGSAEGNARLMEAGRLSERADGMADSGDRHNAIIFGYKALKMIDEALAAGASPSDAELGKRMIQLDLGERLVAAKRWDEALTLFREVASLRGPGMTDYLRTRALKGVVAASAGTGNVAAVRSAVTELTAVGRDMLARDPKNVVLTRQLAEFLEVDTVLRYLTADAEPPMRAAALETLVLFRAVAAANPDSAEAKRAQFVWAWRNARITNEVPLWKEALDTGLWLETRRELKKYEAQLAETKRKMAAYERKGMINLSD